MTDEVESRQVGDAEDPALQGASWGGVSAVVDKGFPLPAQWRPAADRDRLAQACAVLRQVGIVAYPALGPPDAAQTRERIRAGLLARFPAADCAYLFWTQDEDLRCVGRDGTLSAPLLVHAGGTAISTSAQAAFEMVGLRTESGPEPGTLIVSRP